MKFGSIVMAIGSILLCSHLWAEDEDRVEPQTITTTLEFGDTGEAKHGYGNCQWLYPHDKIQERMTSLPKLESDHPYYFVAKFGDSKDNRFTFIFDQSEGSGGKYDTVYVDLNNDNIISPMTEKMSIEVTDSSKDEPIRIRLNISVGGETRPYFVDLSAFNYRWKKDPSKPFQVNLRDSSYYVGDATFAGKVHKIAILDLDSNGKFNDFERGGIFEGDRILIDFNDDGKFTTRDDEKNESFPYSRYTKVAGEWYSITPTASGKSITVAPVELPKGTITASPRVAEILLTSPDQTLKLSFKDGRAKTIAGTFKLERITLLPSEEFENRWSMRTKFSKPPTIEVTAGEETALPFGEPLMVESVIETTEKETVLKLNLQATGKGGERYTLSQYEGSVPGIVVLDSKERAVGYWMPSGSSNPVKMYVPPNWTGVYRFKPVLDITGAEYQTLDKDVRFENGKLK